MIVGLAAVVASLWQHPGAELVLFHAVWICLALIALGTSSERLHVWTFVAFVGGLALVVEVDDLRTNYEVADTFVELLLDVPAFLALVVLARRNQRLLAAEHEAAVVEQRRNERQGAFFANASHALRTPITIARGHAEMALHATTDPGARADLDVVLDELDRLTRATEKNLRLSLAGEAHAQHLAPVDVHELVRTTVGRWGPTAPRTWKAHTVGAPCLTLADPEQLTEALDALVENAVLATAPGGAISVSSEVGANSIVLSVVDDGHGVDAAEVDRLFEPFEQGPRHANNAAGTGLGLAVVRAVANAHHGDVRMVSAPDAGTTVSITLPRRDASREHSPGGQTPITTL